MKCMRFFYKNQKFPLYMVVFFTLMLSSCQQHQSLPLIGGSQLTIPDDKGWTLVNYWAIWCEPCLKEIPEINKIHQEKPKPLTAVVGIYFDPVQLQDLKTYIQKANVQYPILQPDVKALPVPIPQMLPANYLVDPQGKVHGPLLGPQTVKSILTAIRKFEANTSDQ